MSEDNQPAPSDSRTTLRIGAETFPVVSREELEGDECPNGHPLFLVETETAGKFKVCDVCSLSQWIAPA